jgi:uncharacterized OB-fold protein
MPGMKMKTREGYVKAGRCRRCGAVRGRRWKACEDCRMEDKLRKAMGKKG